LCLFLKLMLNNRLDILLLYSLVQLSLHHFIVNMKEVIFLISLVNIVSQTFLHIDEFFTKVIMLLLNPLQCLLDELILSLNLSILLFKLTLKISNI